MKNLLKIFFLVLTSLFFSCEEEEYFDQIKDSDITIVVKIEPCMSMEFHTQIAKYEYGEPRVVLLEGDLAFRPGTKKRPAYHSLRFVVRQKENPDLYQALLTKKIQVVAMSIMKEKLMLKNDVEVVTGYNEIIFK